MQKKITILLVDDQEDDLYIFKRALKQVDVSVKCVTAESGKEAVEKLMEDAEFLPDYIFMDLNMPVMDGKKSIREIRKVKNNKHTPIIIHSTKNLKEDAVNLIETGASFYFQKPNSIDELAAILEKILSAHIGNK
ncbi:MAG: response regulator [Chitinophagaceae bacterium]|jgi:CheY-like chemotaxis protein|nr:response regulator [Chitinophagaceae bacterium]